jgi:hypothetical protein
MFAPKPDLARIKIGRAENFELKIHSGCRQSILGGVCHLINIMFWDINIPPPVIDSKTELSVLNRIVLDGFELELLGLKLFLDASNQS